MAKSFDRKFDEFMGVLPEKEEPSEALRMETQTRFSHSPREMKREWAWLRMLERQREAVTQAI